ncbi:OmpA family protein [Chelativorans sp. AA-79]|uniref:OmpA family protein n=1 Tax=Chelativorans sp. AA-79 TaxID=3028735 RepID=UPI0023F79AFF|nr:OmpA family protein [Chelativorans sp. AA-79]WEX10877.1 OmpA family protein [Chelativorans sp. AA-79]
MREIVFASAVAAVVVFSPASFAQEKQSAEDIVRFFSHAIDLGAQRGICVGTEQECAERRQQQNAELPTGLDMLVNFDLDSAELTSDARAKLTEFAAALKDNRLQAHSFVVEGHTDARGSELYNEGLSERRARAVAAFLIANGVEASRLEALGKGMSAPRVNDPYDPVNRRVEMRISMQ